MNRKKKVKSTLKAKVKKANAKKHSANKPKYISKAEREKLAQMTQEQEGSPSPIDDSSETPSAPS